MFGDAVASVAVVIFVFTCVLMWCGRDQMIDRTLGFTALGGLTISCFILWREHSYAVTTGNGFYPGFTLHFILSFGVVIVTSIALSCRLVFRLTQNLARGLRWRLSIISATFLGFEGIRFLMGFARYVAVIEYNSKHIQIHF